VLRFLSVCLIVACSDVLQLSIDFDEKRFCFLAAFFSNSSNHMNEYFSCVSLFNAVFVPLSYVLLWLSSLGKLFIVARVALSSHPVENLYIANRTE
jgi:hypothetical protein